jgi:CubicO group peptidase (beta-lactamase class C family)
MPGSRLAKLVVVLSVLAAHTALAKGRFEWGKATPESQKLSSEKLTVARDALEKRGTHALLIIRNDKIVYEWYAEGWSRTTPHGTASLAKAVVGGMTLAVALNDGRIKLDDPAWKYLPQWKDDPRKSQITIRQLGAHASGLDDANEKGTGGNNTAHMAMPGWKGDFWRAAGKPPLDPFTIARDAAPLRFDPGKDSYYSSPGIALLGYAVTRAVGTDLRTLLHDRILQGLGVPEEEWSVGYGKTWELDGLKLVPTWGGGKFSPDATARIGRLMMRKGDWNGKRLLSANAVAAVTSDAGTPGVWAQGWWSAKEPGPGGIAPPDAYYGRGAGGQILLVVPSLSLIAVRFANDPSRDATSILNAILETVTDLPPRPTQASAQPAR